MEKSMKLSKAVLLAIFLVVIASCMPFSSASGAPASAPGGTVETCTTIDDCKTVKCIPEPGWHVECVVGKCKCVFIVPPRDQGTKEACSRDKDCESLICPAELKVYRRCVNGICKCVNELNPPAKKTIADQGCPPSDCFDISCDEGCPERVHGRCQCVRPGSF